jgi:hypothetical protein
MSGDPLIGGAMGIFNNESELAWFKSFLYLEAYVSYTATDDRLFFFFVLNRFFQPVSTPRFRNRCLWPLAR